MQEILDVLENSLAMAGYDIVFNDEESYICVYDKEKDMHYQIRVEA